MIMVSKQVSVQISLIYLITVVYGFLTPVNAQAPDTIWTATFGGSQWDQGNSVLETPDGDFVVAGLTWSFGGGASDVFLVKTNDTGDSVFQKTYGGGSADRARSIDFTSDGGFIIVGETESFGAGWDDFYLLRTDALGDTLWTRTYGGAHFDEGWSVQETSDGGFIMTGWTRSSGAGSYDVFVIKTDYVGDTLWTRTIGGSAWDAGYAIRETSNGDFIVVGETGSFGPGSYAVYLSRLNSAGDILWTRTYGGSSEDVGKDVRETSDGGFIITGFTWSFGPDMRNVYIIRTDSVGDTLWTRTYGGSATDVGNSVIETSCGNFVIAGETDSFGSGGFDIYLLMVDANGDTLWTGTYGGPDDDSGFSVRQTADGGFIITGEYTSPGDGWPDLYLLKLNTPQGIGDAESATVCHILVSGIMPNPFTGSMQINYELPVTKTVSIAIYDLHGRRIRTIMEGQADTGAHVVYWDGKDEYGSNTPDGIYFLVFQADGYNVTRKLLKM
jgi:hypothetical protein